MREALLILFNVLEIALLAYCTWVCVLSRKEQRQREAEMRRFVQLTDRFAADSRRLRSLREEWEREHAEVEGHGQD